MQPTPEQIAIMAGLAASVIVWLVKVLWPKYDNAATLYKLVPAVLGPVLLVGFAAHWAVSWELAWQVVLTVVSSLGAYGVIGRPLLHGIRNDQDDIVWAQEQAATEAATNGGGV